MHLASSPGSQLVTRLESLLTARARHPQRTARADLDWPRQREGVSVNGRGVVLLSTPRLTRNLIIRASIRTTSNSRAGIGSHSRPKSGWNTKKKIKAFPMKYAANARSGAKPRNARSRATIPAGIPPAGCPALSGGANRGWTRPVGARKPRSPEHETFTRQRLRRGFACSIYGRMVV